MKDQSFLFDNSVWILRESGYYCNIDLDQIKSEQGSVVKAHGEHFK